VRRGLIVACEIAPEGNLSAAELLERAERLSGEKEDDLWVHTGRAIALYRAGRFDDARLQCENVRRGPTVPDKKLALAYLRSMCLHRLGRSAEARQLLQAAQAWSGARPAIPASGAATTRSGAPEITMYIVRQTLQRQAAELLGAKEDTSVTPAVLDADQSSRTEP
jgi:hypothetical protein